MLVAGWKYTKHTNDIIHSQVGLHDTNRLAVTSYRSRQINGNGGHRYQVRCSCIKSSGAGIFTGRVSYQSTISGCLWSNITNYLVIMCRHLCCCKCNSICSCFFTKLHIWQPWSGACTNSNPALKKFRQTFLFRQ